MLSDDILYHVYMPRAKKMLTSDCLIKQWVVPIGMRADVLVNNHDSQTDGAHQGKDSTLYAIKHKYYWPGMYMDIEDYVKKCQM